jgi:hypothetical protein
VDGSSLPKRKRAPKFTPKVQEVVAVLFTIAADCPYTHERDSQKKVFKKCLKFCHRNNLITECVHPRQLKAWCDKICETNYAVMQKARNQSGVGEIPKPTVLDTVTSDWADFQLKSGKISKVNQKHAEFIRQACVSTSTPVSTFAAEIASVRQRHNAITRTAASTSSSAHSLLSPVADGASASSTTPVVRPREAFAAAMLTLGAGAPARQGCDTFRQETATPPEGFETFRAQLVACELQTFGGASKLDVHVATIMNKLGVSNMEELREVGDGQEAACNLPVLHTNRLKAIIAAQKSFS